MIIIYGWRRNILIIDNLFFVYRHSGKIFLAKPLDDSTPSTFDLNVAVSCVGATQCSSKADVKINVTPVFGDGRHSHFSKV